MSLPTKWRTAADLAGLVAGFACWALAFAGFYALHGWLCSVPGSRVDPLAALSGWVVAMMAAHAAIAALLYRRQRAATDRGRRKLIGLGVILALVAPIATLASVAVALPLAPCRPLAMDMAEQCRVLSC